MLTAEPRLVTINGADGTGKSTSAKKLAEKLQERFGKDKVILVSGTKLEGGPKQVSYPRTVLGFFESLDFLIFLLYSDIRRPNKR